MLGGGVIKLRANCSCQIRVGSRYQGGALPLRVVAAVGEQRTGLGRDGTDVHREELGVVIGSVPVAPARVPRAGPELLVRSKRVDQRRVRPAPAAVAALPVVSVDAVGSVKVQEGVLPVAGLVHPVELDVVDCEERGGKDQRPV